MATYTAQEAVSLLDTSFSDILESDSEEDIEEDPSFPLPRTESESEDDLGEVCTSIIDTNNNIVIIITVITILYRGDRRTINTITWKRE